MIKVQEDKSEELHDIVHDVNNMLTTIYFASSIIKEYEEPELQELSYELNDSLDQVKSFLKLLANPDMNELRDWDIRVLGRIIAQKYKKLYGVKYEFSEYPYILFGSKIDILRLLTNLLDNALKYYEKNKDKLPTDYRFYVALGSDQKYLWVANPFIEEEFKLEYWNKGHSGTNSTGRGLAIIRELARNLDLDITTKVENKAGVNLVYFMFSKKKRVVSHNHESDTDLF